MRWEPKVAIGIRPKVKSKVTYAHHNRLQCQAVMISTVFETTITADLSLLSPKATSPHPAQQPNNPQASRVSYILQARLMT